MVDVGLSAHYVRTAAGQAEIGARALGLSRAARNLLLVINASKTAQEWLQALQGVSSEDLAYLLELGLLTPDATPSSPAANPEQMAWQALSKRINAATYDQLYTALTAQAKAQLGVMKGYRIVLDLEKADGVEGLRKVALVFAEEVRASRGMGAVQELYRLLA
ncbi:hypothetical protein [Ideonella sp.]|jgi:hypothetical protein|uniref:hypothetical protein n=1 Tax=Ideonella sp. TaxID=1929293 RepID=UPI0037C08E9E